MSSVIGVLDGFEIAKRYLIEAFGHRSEAFKIFLLSAGGECRQRAAVERAFKCNDTEPLRMAVRIVVLASAFDGAFHGFGAGITEEHEVGEACRTQPLRGALGFRNLVEVGDVPQLLRLLGQGGDEMGVRVPESVHGNAGGKVEVAFAVRRRKPNAFASLKGEVHTRKRRHQMRCHGKARVRGTAQSARQKRNVPPLRAARSAFYLRTRIRSTAENRAPGFDLAPHHPHAGRKVWTHAERVLRQTHAIL